MSGRIRTVKPEWLEDERLALASSDARVLSIALVLLADDHGRGRASRVMLAGQVFAGKPRDTLGKALEELRGYRYVHIYEVEGQSYFEIRNWFKHQKIDHPSKAKVPAPPDDSSAKSGVFESAREVLGESRETIEQPRASRDPGPCPDPSPDPETRARPRGWKRFPEVQPDDSCRQLAAKLGVDLEYQMELIRDQEFAKPRTDPMATLRTWIRRAVRFGTATRPSTANGTTSNGEAYVYDPGH